MVPFSSVNVRSTGSLLDYQKQEAPVGRTYDDANLIDDITEYNEYVIQELDALPDDAYSPSLHALDELVGSLSIGEQQQSEVFDAEFDADVTIPDSTVLEPEESFVKTWRIENTGERTWEPGFQLVFVDGDQMDAPGSVDLPQSVAPGDEVDISVNMMAPSSVGTYRGYWQMRDLDGVYFGKPIWVIIKVSSDQSSPSNVTSASPEMLEVIHFSRGSSSTTLDVNLTGSRGFSIGALADQWLNITTSRATQITVLDPDGTPLVPVEESDTYWEFRLPQSGNYTMILQGNGEVSMTVEIPPLE